jgi:hypothetical protein
MRKTHPPLSMHACMHAGAAYAISLWRPDMITGVIELTHDLRIAKADVMAALALGRELPDMHMRHLGRVVKLTPGFDFDELLGWRTKTGKAVKKKKQVRHDEGRGGEEGRDESGEGYERQGKERGGNLRGAPCLLDPSPSLARLPLPPGPSSLTPQLPCDSLDPSPSLPPDE